MIFAHLLFASVFLTLPDKGLDCAGDEPCTLAAQHTQASFTIDGVLDEADWRDAPIATGFLQYEPSEGDPASQQTEVRILFGATALYVGAMLQDTSPEEILTTLGRRDEFSRADWFVVAIDSYYDRKTAYNFAVSAAGVQADGIYAGRRFGGGGDSGGFDFDTSWDAIWDSAVHMTPGGWAVELRIPYSMLRFSDATVQRWGINFQRIIPRLSEINEWVLVRLAERSSGPVAQYGTIEGITRIRQRRNLQVTPYTVSYLQTEEADQPGELSRQGSINIGGDIKVGLSSNITLDATINPDFGQVEADPAELNLSAFETFFPERRAFFTEGVQIFRYDLDRGGSMLYTRRIGAHAPIIGATKLSGRSGKLSFGLFGAATGTKATPGRYYGVGRLQQQIGRISTVGGMLTYFDRSVDGRRRSIAGGMDWDLRFRDNRYRFDGQISATNRAQPGTGESPESGFALTAGFDRLRSNWNISTGLTVISDRYNPNDLGRQRRNNYTNLFGGVSHLINGGTAVGPFQRAEARLYFGNGFSFKEGLNNGFGFFFFSEWTTHGFQEIGIDARGDYLFGGYDVTETRGLGPRARPRELNVELSVSSDTRRKWTIEPSTEIALYSDGGRAMELSLEAEWSVSSRINVLMELGAGQESNVIEWAANEAFVPMGRAWGIGENSGSAPDDEETYRPLSPGAPVAAILARMDPYDSQGRYFVPVFGLRNTRSVDLTLRSDLTLTPRLSLQFYGQLFIARGAYDRFWLLENRDTLTPVSDFPKQYDFSFNSFQTNTVLRWEYRPGSTLFLVWSQTRRASDNLDSFDLDTNSPFLRRSEDQLLDTFDLFPTNVFLIKLNYAFLR